jgi:hypothetical protein
MVQPCFIIIIIIIILLLFFSLTSRVVIDRQEKTPNWIYSCIDGQHIVSVTQEGLLRTFATTNSARNPTTASKL